MNVLYQVEVLIERLAFLFVNKFLIILPVLLNLKNSKFI